MILSCAEVYFDKPNPALRQWTVSTTPSETPDGILEKCGKIPKPNGENDKHPEWKCRSIECSPMDRLPSSGETLWRISAHYELEIEVAEESDEPQFPPYTGPKGEQPDGSFVLTPRCYHVLSEMFAHKWNRINLPDYHEKWIEKLGTAIYEDIGHSFMELT